MIFQIEPKEYTRTMFNNLLEKKEINVMLSDMETKVLNKTSQRNIIRAQIKALNHRLIVCTSDKEHAEIEEEIALLEADLKKLQ